MGAEWVMPGDAELRSWADRFGIAMAEAGVDYLRREARGPGASNQDEQDAFLAAADASLATIPPDGSAGLTLGSFLDALDAPGGGRDAVRMRLQGTNAVDLGQVALRVVGAGPHAFAAPAATYQRMARGNQALPDAIAASLPDVRLGHRVRAVVHEATGVRVEVEGDIERVRHRSGGGASGARGLGDAVRPVPAGRTRDGALRTAHGCGVQARGSRRGRADTARGPKRRSPVLVLDRVRRRRGPPPVPRGVRRVRARAGVARDRQRGPRSVARPAARAEPRRHALRHARAQVVGAGPHGDGRLCRVGQPLVGSHGAVPTHRRDGWPSPESTPPARTITAPWRVRSDRASGRRRRCSRCSADGRAIGADTMLARAHVRAHGEPRRREEDPWPTPPPMNPWC